MILNMMKFIKNNKLIILFLYFINPIKPKKIDDISCDKLINDVP
jgi:hypothetical protein